MTRYALVPVEATEEMIEAFYDGAEAAKKASFSTQKFPYGIAPAEWFPPAYEGAIAASPGGGRVTEEQVEKAQFMRVRYFGKPTWTTISEDGRESYRADVRAALAAIGLQVEGDGQEGEAK